MNIVEMHHNFILRANKLDSLAQKEFTPLERDAFLNEAIIAFVNRSYNGTNMKRLGFEQTQEMLDEIRSLIVYSPHDQPWIAPAQSTGDMNIININDFKYEYLHVISAKARIEGCDKELLVNFVQYDDLFFYLNNELHKPSNQWGRVIGTIANDKMIIHAETKLNAIAPSYIKYPAKVSLGGYQDINGNLTTQTDCDLPKNTHDKIIDLAVLIAQGVVENPAGYQTAQSKLVINS